MRFFFLFKSEYILVAWFLRTTCGGNGSPGDRKFHRKQFCRTKYLPNESFTENSGKSFAESKFATRHIRWMVVSPNAIWLFWPDRQTGTSSPPPPNLSPRPHSLLKYGMLLEKFLKTFSRRFWATKENILVSQIQHFSRCQFHWANLDENRLSQVRLGTEIS